MIEAFDLNGLTYVDHDTLSDAQKRAFTQSLTGSLQQVPASAQCDGLGLDPDGDFPIIRLGGLSGSRLADAWWLGCSITQPESTIRAIVLSSRVWPGLFGDFNERWMFALGARLVTNGLAQRSGPSIKFKDLRYSFLESERSHAPRLEKIAAEGLKRLGHGYRTVTVNGLTTTIIEPLP